MEMAHKGENFYAGIEDNHEGEISRDHMHHVVTFTITQKTLLHHDMITQIFPSKRLNHSYVAAHLPFPYLSRLHARLFF